jgi:hypothetical protein
MSVKGTNIQSKLKNHNSWFPHIELILDLFDDKKLFFFISIQKESQIK